MRDGKMALNSKSSLTLTVITGCVAVSLLAGKALAADVPTIPGLYSESGPAPAFTWTGSYFGVQTGAGQMAGEVTSTTKSKYNKAGFAGGIFAGHNWQASRFILGLEGDFTYMGNHKRFNHATLGPVSVRNNWVLSAKGRVGLPVDRFMPYLSAGVSASDFKLSANGTTKNSTDVSINFGAGLEYALSDKVRLRADYSLGGLSHMTKNFGGASVKSEAASHRLMVGVAYTF